MNTKNTLAFLSIHKSLFGLDYFDIDNVFIITIRKRPAPKRELKEEDVTRHLVFAFNGFLDRQGKKEPVDEEKVNYKISSKYFH